MAQQVVHLITKDNVAHTLEDAIVMSRMSGFVREKLKDSDGEEIVSIHLPNINHLTLQKVIEYCEYYSQPERVERKFPMMGTRKEEISDWDNQVSNWKVNFNNVR